MKKIIVSFLAAVVMLCGANKAMAWGTVGHHCAAYIAEQHLTPEAKEKCRYYLNHTLSYYAMWMDRWRGIKQFEAVNNGHSVRSTENGRKVTWEAFTSSTMGSAVPTPPGRAMGHLLNALNELGNGNYKNLPDSVVRQRLINMIHYVPDMHCPSHCGFPEKMYKPASKYDLKRKGKWANYHSLWDGSPSFFRKNLTVKKYADMVDKVSAKESKKWQKGLEQKNLQKGIGSWDKIIIENAREAYAIIPEGTDIAKMTKEHKEQFNNLADRAILVGAYRLAYVLNTIFKE